MEFYSKCFYLMYIFHYIVVGSSELEFHAMALGHSGLLIYWDPTKINFLNYILNMTCKALPSKQEVLHQPLPFFENDSAKGQRKFHSLNEDTQYEVTILEVDRNNNDYKKIYHTLKCKTNLKKNSPPEKPYFTWEVDQLDYNTVKITWIPCGKERDCHGNEAGTHFAVKYKMLDSRQTATIIQYHNDHQSISDIYAGRIYEITVISINGDFETSSDPQEVFLQPCSSPVHSVRVLTLSNTSIYVSWKKPKWFTEQIYMYLLSYNSKSDELSELHPHQVENILASRSPLEQVRFYNLEPNIVNTFTIIPFSEEKHRGFEYRFDYSIEPIQTNLPLAKPDFKFGLYFNTYKNCGFNVLWIPCLEISDCKNMSFGSNCEIKIQCGNNRTIYKCGKDHFKKIELENNQTCEFIGKSVNELNQTSESVSRQISCDMAGDV